MSVFWIKISGASDLNEEINDLSIAVSSVESEDQNKDDLTLF